MNWLIFIFAGGAAFFAGVAMVLVSVLVVSICRRRWSQIAANVLAITGLLLIAFSATPLPYWIYAIAGGVTCVWLIAERSSRTETATRKKWVRLIVIACWLTAVGLELPYHVGSNAKLQSIERLCVVGDSLSAGLGNQDTETWPRVIARENSIEVLDHSRVGATAATAIRQVEQFPSGASVVLLEIGGNDLLGSTSSREFEQALDRLLAITCTADRVVIMFELPLPPFHNEFGRVQRILAAKYGVRLIPKRILASVLTESGGTVDSLHLSVEGHRTLAAEVMKLLGSNKGVRNQ